LHGFFKFLLYRRYGTHHLSRSVRLHCISVYRYQYWFYGYRFCPCHQK
jgi:hypothetical protein